MEKANFMHNVTLRKANEADLAAIRDLVIELAIFEKAPHAVTSSLEDYVKAFDTGLISCIVAEYNNEIVGMTLFYDTFSTWKGKMLYLEDFYVKPSMRGRSIGSQLFDAVVNEAKITDCKMIKWQVLDWNVKAIEFYRAKGATIEVDWFNGKIIF